MGRAIMAVLSVLAFATAGHAQDTDQPLATIEVRAALDAARQSIEPSLGATRTDFSAAALADIPQGEQSPLNQVLLQAPGVATDSFGQIHLRGEHANVQYRLNGVQLPEGLSVFGQVLESRFARSAALLTGALPAQYGLNTAGVVDIQTRTGATDPGLAVTGYGGGFGWAQPSIDYGGSSGPFDWYLTGEYLHDDRGIENPYAGYDAIHDTTEQFHGLANAAAVLDQNTRVSLILGGFHGNYQVPNNPGQTPQLGLTVNGVTAVNSATLNERQREIGDFAILSMQRHTDDIDVQVSGFGRYSSLYFSPDPIGDLLFTGIAQNAGRSDTAGGVQTDAAWRANAWNTVRAGFIVQAERTTFRITSQVLPLDATGAQTTDQPKFIHDDGGKTGAVYGVYGQDEIRPLDRLTVNVGLRFDLVDEYTHENQVSPRVNVVWTPTDTTTLTAGYARYFVPPPFELVGAGDVALTFGTSAAPTVTRDDKVKSERSNYIDLGVNQVLIPSLTLGFDGFYKQARNLIDEGQFGAPIILTAFNYARGEVAGGQLTASYEHGPWSLYGNLAYSRAIGHTIVSAQFNFGSDELQYIGQHWIHLDHDQRWTGSGGASYRIDEGDGTNTLLSADVLVESGLRASTATVPNGISLNTYGVVNLSAVQALNLGLGDGTTLRLDVLNVGNVAYEIRNGTGVGVGAPQYGIRRAFLGGVTQRF